MERLLQNGDFQAVILSGFIDNYIHTAYLNLPVFTGDKEKQTIDRIKARGILQRYMNEIIEHAKMAKESKEEEAKTKAAEDETIKARDEAEKN